MKWKDFLLLIKRKYYPNEKTQNVSLMLRERMGVTQEMINKDFQFEEVDYIYLIYKI